MFRKPGFWPGFLLPSKPRDAGNKKSAVETAL